MNGSQIRHEGYKCTKCNDSGLRQVMQKGHWIRHPNGTEEYIVDDTRLMPTLMSSSEIDSMFPDVNGKYRGGYQQCATYCECYTQRRADTVIAKTESAASIPNNRNFTWVDFAAYPEAADAAYQFATTQSVVLNGVERSGVMIVGTTGTGKTTLSMLTFKTLVNAGFVCHMQEWRRLIHDLQDTYRPNYSGTPYSEIMKYLCDVPILFVDDLGEKGANGVEPASNNRIEIAYELFGHREAKRLPAFISTNLNSQERLTHFGPQVDSRLSGLCHVVAMKGKDLRKVGSV